MSARRNVSAIVGLLLFLACLWIYPLTRDFSDDVLTLEAVRQISRAPSPERIATLWSAHDTPVLRVRMGDKGVRAKAAKQVVPSYPEDCLRRRVQGIVKVNVTIDDAGKLIYTEVVDSPEPLISAAVTSALREWVFAPATVQEEYANQVGKTGGAAFLLGTLLFYFEIREGFGYVLSPAQKMASSGGFGP